MVLGKDVVACTDFGNRDVGATGADGYSSHMFFAAA